MFYANPYTLWNMYCLLRIMYSTYVSYTILVWFARSTSSTFLWMLQWIYNPYHTRQIADTRLDEID